MASQFGAAFRSKDQVYSAVESKGCFIYEMASKPNSGGVTIWNDGYWGSLPLLKGLGSVVAREGKSSTLWWELGRFFL